MTQNESALGLGNLLKPLDANASNGHAEARSEQQLAQAQAPAPASSAQDPLSLILAGMGDLQKEIARLHVRMDDMERNGSPAASPAMRPHALARAISTRSFKGGESRSRPSSPDKTSSGNAPAHVNALARSSNALSQPAPLLATPPDLGLWCVVPAGGAGTRLWPLSRESYPKFLLDLVGRGRTLLQSTWDRLLPLAGADRMIIVTGTAHVGGVSDQLPELLPDNVLAEPSPKESMAAIGLAAAVLARRDPDAVLGSFAADHIISGRDAFESAVKEAVVVANAGYLVTIGIAPSYPSTGFGYIKLGELLAQKTRFVDPQTSEGPYTAEGSSKLDPAKAPNARRVTEFKEKPDARTASAYLSTGDYRWNGGMFVVKAKILLELLSSSMPALHSGLMEIANAWETSSRMEVLGRVWPTLDKIAIDHAIAEPAAKAGRVAVVPATFGWDDVGDFSSLADLLPAEKGEARVLGDQKLVITENQAGGIIVPASGRTIACLGVDDVVVVDCEDALLITTRARAQDVKKIVARTKKNFPALC
ncbi:probable mannose-1-phosphate guanylyltransferase [Ceraceosorus bombacis]|uniref:Probable mannose-1-phosphate guanylyltransferase n=1 Tax=Ceraceosorus bombacis TaxID=401625 RepID=A0A0P1BHX7_9BASI|nr:probable mannose-1-phosphate guanylyltransferase [Ceraceosorus bombacis]